MAVVSLNYNQWLKSLEWSCMDGGPLMLNMFLAFPTGQIFATHLEIFSSVRMKKKMVEIATV